MAGDPQPLNLGDLYEGIPVCISAAIGASMAEAAAVCFDYFNHLQGVIMEVKGAFDRQYRFTWREVTAVHKAGWMDIPYTIEQGAYGVAIMLVRDLTSHNILERSYKTTGFDYWLGDDDEVFQRKARLEISGTGDPKRVGSRVAKKKRQTTPTDQLGLPAFIVVVDFKTPRSHVERK